MGNRKIMLSLTTTPGSDWRAKVEEIDKLGLKEIALFPTCLEISERKELYALLEKTGLKQIPHVHLRNDDMDENELKYFTEKYNTQVFNLHPKAESYDFIEKHGKYRKMIYVENLYRVINYELFNEEIFEKYEIAGICLDTAHLKSEQLIFPENYKERIRMLEKFSIGCNHISAIMAKSYNWEGVEIFDTHMLSDFSELDYLKEFPGKYFSDFVSIELENSFEQQLEAKKYIESIINSKK
ncbi:MAG: hypothetical protein WC726_02110 [Parcubacteria group bacterium]|jgi:sugar phosphate isomerase/epimerase